MTISIGLKIRTIQAHPFISNSFETLTLNLGSTFSIMSKSSTLSRLFSRKSRSESRNNQKCGRSVSIDSILTDSVKESGFSTTKPGFARKSTWSTPNTPIVPSSNNPYGTWRRRGRTLDRNPSTPSLGQKLKHAFGPEKQRIGKLLFSLMNF